MAAITIKIAESSEEFEELFRIRRDVFVDEQGILTSDRDEKDKAAIHLVACINGKVIGTVRVYPGGNGSWVGGRLAVKKEYRGKAGKYLVNEACRVVKRRGCIRFVAHVQPTLEEYFKSLGWRSIKMCSYLDKEHVFMEADLGKGD